MEFKETISSKQRQGQYDSTRYHGKYTFSVPAVLKENTISIDSATLTLISTASGKSAARDLWLRAGHATDSSIIYKTGTTKFTVNREATNILTLNVNDTTTLSAIKNGKFGIYVNSSNDGYYFTDSAGKKYSSHYITFSSATLTVNYSYKAGTLNLGKTSVKIGSGGDTAVSATISNHISTYGYKLVVSAGGLSKTYNLGSASSKTLNFTETDYSTWVNGNSTTTSIFKEKTSVSGDITLKTYSDTSYATHLGDSKVDVTFTATLGNPTLTIGTIAYANSGSYTSINSFALPDFGTVTINHTASTKNGAAIKSIAATQNFGTRTSSNTDAAKTVFKVNKGIANGTYEVSLTLTDTRGKTVSAKANVTIKNYTKPTLSLSVVKNSSNKLEATYSYSVFTGGTVSKAYLTCDGTTIANFTTGINSVSSTKYTHSTELNETEHKINLYVEDSYGGKNDLSKVLASTAFYLHFGSSGSTLGIGGSAPSTANTVRCYWNLLLDKPLAPAYGGTGASNQSGAWTNIVAPGGTITGSLTTTSSLIANGSLKAGSTLNIANDNYSPHLQFSPKNLAEYAGSIRYTVGSNYNTGRFYFYQRSLNSDGSGFSGGTERYFLPVTNNGITSGDVDYSILTTKNHYYSHTLSGKTNVFEFGTFLIQTGEVDFGEVSSSAAYKDVSVTFSKSFSAAPVIVIGFNWGSDGSNAGRWSISARAESATGFTARVNNGEGTGRSPDGYWIAIGKRA